MYIWCNHQKNSRMDLSWKKIYFFHNSSSFKYIHFNYNFFTSRLPSISSSHIAGVVGLLKSNHPQLFSCCHNVDLCDDGGHGGQRRRVHSGRPALRHSLPWSPARSSLPWSQTRGWCRTSAQKGQRKLNMRPPSIECPQEHHVWTKPDPHRGGNIL
jgi:hypothetical protein